MNFRSAYRTTFGALLGTAVLGAAVLLGGGQAASAQEFSLRAVANSNENDEDYDGLIVFKDFVETNSNGRIGIEIFLGTQLCGNGTECLQAVEDGQIDIYISTSGGAANIFPIVQLFDLPYIFRDDRVAETVLRSSFVDDFRDELLAQSGGTTRLMTIGNTGGWRNFANTRHTVREPADLAGLKIRTIVADLPQELVKALGASPTPIPWPELFTSFQTGVVEGSKNGITDIMGMSFPDAGLKFLTLDRHAYMAAMWWMNNAAYESMPDDLKAVIVNGFVELQQATFASPKRKSIQAFQDFRAVGGEIYVPTAAQKDEFVAASAPVRDYFVEKIDGGQKWLDRLLEEVGQAETEIDAEIARQLN